MSIRTIKFYITKYKKKMRHYFIYGHANRFRDIMILLIIAWGAESLMDTIKHHQHSSWLFKINWPDYILQWLKSDWTKKDDYLFNLYDGWHSFKGIMLLAQAGVVWRLSSFRWGLLFLLSYWAIHEGLYGWILLLSW